MDNLIPPDRSPPSTTSIILATAIIAVTAGYFIGQGASLGLFSTKKSSSKSSWPNSYDVTIHPDSSDEELMEHLNAGSKRNEVKGSEGEEESEDDVQGELKAFDTKKEEQYKLVLCVRTDLGMTKGKIAAQASHATLACYKYFLQHAPSSPMLRRWESQGQMKIAVKAKSEDELQELQARAMSLGLCARVIHDAGRTQIAAGSATVLGVGPGPSSVVNQVTGELPLL